MADVVEIALALRNVRQFVAGADQASKSIGRIGTSAEKSGKQAHKGWQGVAKWAGGAAAVYGAYRFLKSSVGATEDLGKSTLALNRTTGLSIKQSSEWASVLKSRDMDTKMFQRGLVAFSKQIEKTRLGTKKHNSALEQLGFSSKDAAIQTGDVDSLLLRVSDRFSKMTNPIKRAALTQQLFSRTGIQLAPILYKGSKAIREQLGLADKYGATLSGKSAKSIGEEIQHQRELRMAYLGVQVQLGTALLPVMLTVTGLIVKLTELVQPLTHNSTALAIAIGLVAVAFLAWKVALIASAIAAMFFEGAMAPALLTIGAIALALVAVGVATYFVIKHWDWLKKKAIEVWGWIKANWPLLLGILTGPFGLAIGMIVKHFDAIQAAARRAITIALSWFQRLVDFVKSIPSRIGHPFKGLWHGATSFAGKLNPFSGQHGGVTPRARSTLVGERGPEMLSLPAGARITPLPGAGGSLAGIGGFGGEATIVVPVYLDRREIARAVAGYTADKIARR